MMTMVPTMLALPSAPAPTMSVSCAEISPSTCPSMRPVPSNTSFPVTRVPFPRNASMPPGLAGWLMLRSRSPIMISSRATPLTGMPAAGTTSRSRANNAIVVQAPRSKFEADVRSFADPGTGGARHGNLLTRRNRRVRDARFALRLRACFGCLTMRVINPATGDVLRDVAESGRPAIAAACRSACAAQPAWAATPLAARCEAIRRFRALVVERAEPLARTLALEVGKPIVQARRELAGVLPRVEFFLAEVGGVLADEVVGAADVGAAAAAVADGAFYNAGQSCCAVERIYVHDRIWDRFVAAFVDTVRGYVIGDPFDEQTYIGPLARRDAALAHLDAQVADALGRGARALTGGRRVARPGFFFAPTVLVDVDHTMAVMREETFGPLIGRAPVASDDAAVALMNDTAYGLTAAVYANERRRAERLLAGVNAGSAYWNCCDRVSPRLPWTGRGDSGLGVTLSRDGIAAFVRPKAWHLRGA